MYVLLSILLGDIMRKSVVDSSTLISLAKIDLLSILTKLRENLLAPPIVKNETVIRGADYHGSAGIEGLFKKNVIKIIDVPMELRNNVAVQYGLKKEDAEVLALAIEEGVTELLVNDVKLSKRAETAGFEIISAFDLLYESLLVGVLDYDRYSSAFDTLVRGGEISSKLALFYKLMGLEVEK